MGEVCNVSAASKDLAVQLYDCIEDNQKWSTHRNEAKDENPCIRIEYGKHQQHTVYGSRGSDQNHVCSCQKITYKAYNTTEKACKQVKHEKFLAPYPSLNHTAENKQTQHIEQKMGKPSMHKHIGENLPNIPMQDKRRNHCKIVCTTWIQIGCKQVDQGVDDHQLQGDVGI